MRGRAADDAWLWRRAMRDVAPLPGRGPAAHRNMADREHPVRIAGETHPVPLASPAAVALPVRKPQPPPPPLNRPAGIDRATAERLKRGRYPIDGHLDLHGMTQAEAHRALFRAVAGARAAGRRCLLVITGHGRISGGVLKAAVPRWLGEPGLRSHILAIAPARPHDGGSGALYVLLRRPPQRDGA